MNPSVWGSHYWFFLHTVARHYPTHPSSIHRKIHYRLISNFHEFIPDPVSAKAFTEVLRENPVSPYLDSKRDFMLWTNHVHNVINKKLDKEEVSFEQYVSTYEEYYKPKKWKHRKRKDLKFAVYALLILLLVFVAVSL